ncbi:hypothetical protein [Georgenia yuyongxinii]
MTVEQSATRAATAAGTGDAAQPLLRRRERRPAPVAEVAPGDTAEPVEAAPAAPSARPAAPSGAAGAATGAKPAPTGAKLAPSGATAPASSGAAGAEPARATRRPVVRAPHAAKGMRSLDATGTLTGIQPVPAAAPPSSLPAPDAPTDPTEWESAVHLPIIGDDGRSLTFADPQTMTIRAEPEPEPESEPEPTVTMAPVRNGLTPAPHRTSTATPAQPGGTPAQPEVDVEQWAGADSSDAVLEDDEYDDEPPRPQWTTLAEYSSATGASADVAAGTSPDEAGEPAGRRTQREAERRPLRARVAETARVATGASAHSADDAYAYDEDDDEAAPENPVTSVVKIVILVLAAIVIGLLIGLLAFGGGAEDGAAGPLPTLLAYLGTPGGAPWLA